MQRVDVWTTCRYIISKKILFLIIFCRCVTIGAKSVGRSIHGEVHVYKSQRVLIRR